MTIKDSNVREPIPVWVLGLLVATIALALFNFPFKALAVRQAIKETLGRLEREGLSRSLVDLNASYAYPAGLNAAYAYTNAFSKLKVSSEVKSTVAGFGTIDLETVVKGSDPNVVAASLQLLAANQFALEMLREGNRIESCRYGTDLRNGFNVLLPHLNDVRSGTRLFCLRAVVQVQEENWSGAFDSITNGIQLARSVEKEPLFISQLVLFSSVNSTIEAVEILLNHSEISLGQIEVLVALFSSILDHAPMERAMLGELALVESLYQAGPIGLLNLDKTKEERVDHKNSKIRAGTHVIYDQDFHYFLESVDEVLQSDGYRSQKGMGHLNLLDQRLEQLRESLEHQWFYLSKRFLPVIRKTLERDLRFVATVRGILLVLSIERYRLNHQGALPDSLGDMQEGTDLQVWVDPFTGERFQYERLNPGFQVACIGRQRDSELTSEMEEHDDTMIRFTVAR